VEGVRSRADDLSNSDTADDEQDKPGARNEYSEPGLVVEFLPETTHGLQMNENPVSPRVSVIVATLNARHTLQSCIDSVANQSWSNKELIVCDGVSNDGTVEILERNETAITWWCSERDKGIYNAWNKGLRYAGGDWICFLGADDYFWNANVLERYMAAASRLYPEVRVIYGQVALVADDGRVIRKIGAPWEQEKHRFRQLSCLPHPGLLCHRAVFAQYGSFDESFRISGDYEFLLRELLSRDAYFVPDLITVGMRTGGISSRSKTIRLGYEECRQAQRMHHMGSPGLRWLVGYAIALARWAVARLVGERRLDRWVNFLRSSRRAA
jgi:hypothetical protein